MGPPGHKSHDPNYILKLEKFGDKNRTYCGGLDSLASKPSTITTYMPGTHLQTS